MRFDGKIAIVTGAGSGFGEAIATRFARGRAVEVAPFRIRVNAVNPVAAETGFMKTATGLDRLPDELRRQLVATIPLGRLSEPRDVAAAVLFLASDDAAFLTGVCLDVDGGRSIS